MYTDGAQTLKGRAPEQSRAGTNTALAGWQIPQEAPSTGSEGGRGRVGGGKVKAADMAVPDGRGARRQGRREGNTRSIGRATKSE